MDLVVLNILIGVGIFVYMIANGGTGGILQHKVRCPVCGQRVALYKGERLIFHRFPGAPSWDQRCRGTGTPVR